MTQEEIIKRLTEKFPKFEFSIKQIGDFYLMHINDIKLMSGYKIHTTPTEEMYSCIEDGISFLIKTFPNDFKKQ